MNRRREKMPPFRYPAADPSPLLVGQLVRVRIVDPSTYGGDFAERANGHAGIIERHHAPGGGHIEEKYLVQFDEPITWRDPDWGPWPNFLFPKCDLEVLT